MKRLWWVLALAVGCRPQVPASVNTDAVLMSAHNVPRLPHEVAGILGPIRVEVVERIVLGDSTVEALGAYVPMRRLIFIRDGHALLFQWAVLAHEECHAALIDFGLAAIPMQLQQQICDAMGAARVAAMR